MFSIKTLEITEEEYLSEYDQEKIRKFIVFKKQMLLCEAPLVGRQNYIWFLQITPWPLEHWIEL